MFGAKGLYCFEKILRSQAYNLLPLIKKEYLELDVEFRVYNKIYELLEKTGTLPRTLLSPFFEVDPSLLEGYDDRVDFHVYLDMLRERYAVRLYRMLREGKVPDESNRELVISYLRDVYEKLGEFFNGGNERGVIRVPDVFDEVYINLLRKKLNDVIVPTGYPTLDRWLGGGFLPGETYALVARMKMGKTMYLIWMLWHAIKSGKRCLFVSMEMDLFAIIRRFLGIVYGDKAYVTGEYYLHKDWNAIKERLKEKGYQFDFISGGQIDSVRDIYSLSVGYDVVFVDGAYLLPSHRNYRSEWERVKSVVEELKKIALARDIPVVGTYQFNRGAMSTNDPDLEHIAYSDAIAQTAGAVFSVVNYVEKGANGDVNKARSSGNRKKLTILANRHGPYGSLILDFDWEYMSFCEMEVIEGEVEVIDEEEDLKEDLY